MDALYWGSRLGLAVGSDLGITEGQLFVDNLHFSVAGHRLAAHAISEVLAGLPLVTDGPGEHRVADPSPEVLERTLSQRARDPQSGLDIHVPGANELYKDDSGVSELPGQEVDPFWSGKESRAGW